MLVIEIPYWVIFAAVIVSAFLGVCSMIAVAFGIHKNNWHEKFDKLQWWLLDKYSSYRYKHVVNFTIGTGTNVNAINAIFHERRDWIIENIENCERTTWATGARILANIHSYESVEPTHFAFKFKHSEDLTLFCLRWA